MYDPFVGTGSILVAATHFGAVTLGADIDIRVVRDGHFASDGQARPQASLTSQLFSLDPLVQRYIS